MSGETCSIPNCTNGARSRGMCVRHYTRWIRHGDALAGATPHMVGATPAEVLEARTDKSRGVDGCWLWTGAVAKSGYGSSRRGYAHRMAYEVAHGEIPKGLDVRHSCDVRLCVQPKHLSVGTRLENMRDAVSRDRMTWGEAHPDAKLTVAEVVEIRRRATDGETQRSLASAFGVDQSAISRIVSRKAWKRAA